MAMRVQQSWQGRRLWTERGRQAASEGLARALEHTLGVSNSRVPLRDGPLERSGKVVVNGLDGAISYDTVYAVRQLPPSMKNSRGGTSPAARPSTWRAPSTTAARSCSR